MPDHPQVGQGKQRHDLRRVFLQTTVAHLHISKLLLEHPEGVFHLGPDARLGALQLVDQIIKRLVFVQRPAQAWAHGHVPAHGLPGIGALVRPLVARITKGICLLPVQQAVGLNHVVHVAAGAPHRVHQARIRIHSNVGLHTEVPLVALLALVHLGVTLATLVLGGTGGRNHRGIHHGARLQLQALGLQQCVDRGQDLFGQLVAFQQVPEAQDARLAGDVFVPTRQTCEVTKRRHIMQRFFHGGVAELEPLLHEVDAQQRLYRKGLLAPPSTLGSVGLYQRYQFGPGNHQLHGVQEFALAGVLDGVAQAQAALLHVCIVWASGPCKHIRRGFVQRIPKAECLLQPATFERRLAV